MPRYYFTVEMPDHTYDDPNGELLPSDGAAKDFGRRVVRELKESDFESAGAVLRVTVEGGQTIHSIPFDRADRHSTCGVMARIVL